MIFNYIAGINQIKYNKIDKTATSEVYFCS